MTERLRLRRRQFLAASGIALAHSAIAGRAACVAAAQPAAKGKPGVAPGYITSGRGENLSNPYFNPLGGPSSERGPVPPPRQGKGVNEDNQGENQR